MPATARSYQEEQEQLQQTTGDKDVHIDAPVEPEVDFRFYADVESLLFRGFIHVTAEINGVSFVLKSLNQNELMLLRMMHGGRNDAKAQRVHYSRFLAYGVLMVDGENILPNRDTYLHRISEVFDGLPNAGRQKLIRILGEVNRRASGAVILTEAYAVETASRFRWMQFKGIDLCSPTVTGFPGTERLGLNWAQLAWRAINHFEDLRETSEREWENAKFVGSCFAGKEIQKIYTRDTNRRRREREDRLAIRDKLLRQVVLEESPEDTVVRDGQVLITARTVSQLADQLERSLKGDKDWHDEMVSRVEEQNRQRELQRQSNLQQAALERRAEFNNQTSQGGTSFDGLSPEEVSDRIAKRRPMTVVEPRPEESPEFMDKWVLREDQPVAIEAPLVPVSVRKR